MEEHRAVVFEKKKLEYREVSTLTVLLPRLGYHVSNSKEKITFLVLKTISTPEKKSFRLTPCSKIGAGTND